VVNQLIQSQRASVEVLNSGASWFGITYKEDRSYVEKRIRELIHSGIYPNSIINK